MQTKIIKTYTLKLTEDELQEVRGEITRDLWDILNNCKDPKELIYQRDRCKRILKKIYKLTKVKYAEHMIGDIYD